jgi:hypothetical protein
MAGIAADSIAEVFGKNLFGKDPNYERKAKEIKEEAEKQKKEQNPKEKSNLININSRMHQWQTHKLL